MALQINDTATELAAETEDLSPPEIERRAALAHVDQRIAAPSACLLTAQRMLDHTS